MIAKMRSNINRIVEALPHSLFISSLGDNLLADSLQYVEYLKSQDKHAELEYINDSNLKHDFTLFYPELEESKKVVRLITEFLKKKHNPIYKPRKTLNKRLARRIDK